jgi:hypothetical protein
MKLLLVLLACVVAGSYVIPHAMDQTRLIALKHAFAANAQCSDGCKGDFPTTSRKYAGRGNRYTPA